MMNHKVSIYVPVTTKLDEAYTSTVARRMASMFGGATVISAKGAWVNDKQEVIYDDINIVYSYCDALALVKCQVAYTELCIYIKKELQQDCISLVIDETLNLI
jgi:hypothetical protein